MKKAVLSVLVIFVLAFGLSGQATQQAQQPKPEDVLKNLVLVEKPQAVPDKMKTGFDSITAKDSLAMLTYISSDLMEGRETTTRGYQLAAEYAASLFTLWKLKPAGDQPGMGRMGFRGFDRGADASRAAPQEKSFLQELALKETTDSSTQISLEAKIGASTKARGFRSGMDFVSMSSSVETVSAPVVFAGFGITEKEIGYDDFKSLDVKGKIVLILSEAPGKDNPKSPFQQKKELKEKYFPAAPMGPFGRGGGFNKTQEIAKLGVAAILQVQNTGKDSDLFKGLAGPRQVSDERPGANRPRRRLSIPGLSTRMPWEQSPVITITREMANAILEASGQKIDDLKKKIDDAVKPASMEVPGARLSIETTAKTALTRCRNVLGYIEGSDPALKNEVVVIGAHLDHLGKFEEYIFNGSDDNGSGSVGVMNLARAFAANPVKPKRSVLFCLWTGEEQGLLGAEYYTTHPIYPLERTLADAEINILFNKIIKATTDKLNARLRA